MECPRVISIDNEKLVKEIKKEPDVGSSGQKEKPNDFIRLLGQNKGPENNSENLAAYFSTECIVKVEAEPDDFEDGDDSGVDETTEAVPVCMRSERHVDCTADRNDDIEMTVTTKTRKKDKVENSKQDFQCDTCRKFFFNAGTLKRHMLIHLQDKPFKCGMCDYSANDSHCLKEHQQRHQGLYFVCEICSAIFYRKSGLKKHMKKLHESILDDTCKPTHFQGKTSKFFICDICNKKFKEEHKFKQHIESRAEPNTYQEGNEARPYKCEECNKSYFTQRDLKNHMALHSQVNAFTCEFCNKCFPTAFHLRKHRYTHTKVKNHICETCGKKFNALSRLLSHETIHSDSKPHVCSICNKSYPRQKSLKRHMLIHDGSKPHLCSVCGKNFATKDALTGHKRIHSDEKPYCCDFCGKLFRNSSDLRRHKLSHDDNLPHECEICGRKFRLRDNMKKHMRAHDPDVRRERNLKRQYRYRRQKEIKSNAKEKSCIGGNTDQEYQEAEDRVKKAQTGFVLQENKSDMVQDQTDLRNRFHPNTIKEKSDKNIAVFDRTLLHDTDIGERFSDNLTDQQLEKARSNSNFDDVNGVKIVHIDIDNTPTSYDAQDSWLHKETKDTTSYLGKAGDEEFTDPEVAMPSNKDIDNCETTVLVIYENNLDNGNELLTETATSVNQNTDTDAEEVIHHNLHIADTCYTNTGNDKSDSNQLTEFQGQRNKKEIIPRGQILLSDDTHSSGQKIKPDNSYSEMNQIYGARFRKFRFSRKPIQETDIEQTHRCRICEINFRLYDTLLMHMIHVHDLDEEEAEHFC